MDKDASPTSFLEFTRQETRAKRAGDRPPQTAGDWADHKRRIRNRLAAAFGEFPSKPCELDPHLLGTIQLDGYRIERLIFQSRPGIWVTANAFVPDLPGDKLPAVLSVHGHWPWARIDPVPQARAIGLAKLGYFVLTVDAFGAGERAIEPARGTYHGALLGASTWPVGTPLLGLQVYDNMRAVDYLLTRPEVDGERLAITGASGGGNQSMNAGAWDERFKVVVPVCSVGTYDAYLGSACCVCEVLPGGLTIGEEGDILGLVAPRALMVINATRDAHQFSVGEAEKSIARAKHVFDLLDAASRLRHVVIDSEHDYNKPMREALYGWLARWLRAEGDGSPVSEPEVTVQEIESLRCFPDNVRPPSFMLLPAFVQDQGKRKLERIVRADHRERFEADAALMKTRLETEVFGGFPRTVPWSTAPLKGSEGTDTRQELFVLYPEPDMPVPCTIVRRKNQDGALPTVILIEPAGMDAALNTRLAHQLLDRGWQLLALDLRATGQTAVSNEKIRDAIDHNSAEWAIWMGRPLIGQWCWDVIRAIDYLTSSDRTDIRQVALIGTGAGALVAICAGAFDERVRSVAANGLLASFVSAHPPEGHRMATFVPFILDVGDVPHVAALLAPRRLLISAPVDAQNRPIDAERIGDAFAPTQDAYQWYSAAKELRIQAAPQDDFILNSLRVG